MHLFDSDFGVYYGEYSQKIMGTLTPGDTVVLSVDVKAGHRIGYRIGVLTRNNRTNLVYLAYA